MLQDHVTPLPLALVAAVHGACLLALMAVLRTRTAQFPGWRVVRPGGTHWFCFVGCWAFATLVSWVWLFVGSARRDAEAQMRWALLLILAFGIGSALSGFYIAQLRRRALRWRGTTIQWRERGRDLVQDLTDFDGFRRAFSGLFHVHFRDGTILKLDLYARNAEDFAVAISEQVGRDIEFGD
jgi:hypothetical protein